MDSLQKLLNKSIDNPIIYSVLALFLAIYSPRLAPKIPNWLMDLFQNEIFKFIILLLVVYVSSKDLQLSLLISIAFVMVMSIVNYQYTEEQFSNYMETFQNIETPLESTSVSSNRANNNDMMNVVNGNAQGREYFRENTNGETFNELKQQEEAILSDLRERYTNPY